MTKRAKVEYWHKKQGRETSPSATARHASVKDGRPVPNPAPKLTGAQEFIRKLKQEIRRSV
jgi:hypothetical protein